MSPVLFCLLALGPSVAAGWQPWTTNAPELPGSMDTCFTAKATTLQNGSVLVAGGAGGGPKGAADHEVKQWDPASNEWHMSTPMIYGRSSFGLVTMADGRVMAAGGDVWCNDGTGYRCESLSNTAEILDPATSVWTQTANMGTARQYLMLAALPDGSVVAFGGTNRGDKYGDGLKTAEKWSPTTEQWEPIEAQMWRGMNGGNAVTCNNGSVLVVSKYGASNGAVLFDPATQTFTGQKSTDLALMTVSRGNSFGLVALTNGSFLAAGGFDGTRNLRSAEVYMPPPVNKWVAIEDMNYERAGATAAPLLNNSVLVAGAPKKSGWSNTAELFDPSQWRCFSGGEGQACNTRNCQRSHDGTGVDLRTCQESCGAPAGGAPHYRCVQDQCVELPGATGVSKAVCDTICGRGGAVPCATVEDFTAVSAAVRDECCDEASESCNDGTPSSCNAGCAAVLIPANVACTAEGGVLNAPSMSEAKTLFVQAVSTCRTHGH